MFRLSSHPAAATVTGGIQDAFTYLGASWKRWLPVVVAISACTFVLSALLGSIDTTNLYYTNRFTNQITWYPDAGNRLIRAAVFGLLTGLVTLVGSWVFTATAIAGLRNKPLTISDIVVRGVLSFIAGIIVGVAVICAVIVLVIVTIAVPPIGFLLLLAATPVAIYFAIRIIFASLAIFDGFGPIEGIQESWRLSNGSVGRLFGWGLMAGLISIGFSIVGTLLAAPFDASKAQPLGQAFSAAVTTIGSCFTVFMLAVLYESERARKDPTTYGYAPGVSYGWPNPSWPYPGTPNQYAPQQYPPGQYPYAPNQFGGGQYPTPQYPGAYPTPQYPGAYPPAPYPPAYPPAPYPGPQYPAAPSAPAPGLPNPAGTPPTGPGPDPTRWPPAS